MIRIGLIFLLLVALRPVTAWAQTWEVFDGNTAGFPSNNVSSLIEDHDGQIWAGTSFGLCSYDGSDWTIYQTGTSGLPGDVVKCLAVDTLGKIWVGTLLNGIGIFDGVAWEYLNTGNSPLPDNEINCITIDHRGWAWIGTYLGLTCYTGTDWFQYNASDTSYAGLELHGNVVQDVQVRQDGLVAIATLNGGFHYLTDTSVVALTTFDDNFPDNTQNAVAFDNINNERWLASPSQGLLRQGGDWSNGPWFKYTTQNSTIPSNAITSVAVDAFSQVWFGTLLAGLGVRRTDGSFINYTTGNSDLPDNTVTKVLLASDGSIWVATGYGGAARMVLPEMITTAAKASWRVFPNPCTDHVFMDGPHHSGPIQWSLHDPAAQVVAQGNVVGGRLHLGDHPPGTYFLRLFNRKEFSSIGLIILP